MKWTRKFLASLLAVASTVSVTDQALAQDDGVFVGDTPTYVGDYDGASASDRVPAAPQARTAQMRPAQRSRVAPASHTNQSNASCSSADCCDSGCDSCDSIGGASPFKLAACGGGSGWANVDFAFWFPQAREMQPILTSSAPGTAPIPGSPGFQTLFGNEVDPGMTPGVRFDAGTYFGPGQLVGLGARGFYMGTSEDSVTVGNNGVDFSLGRYFYDARSIPITNRIDNAAIVAVANNGGFDPVFSGTARAQSELDYYGAELYGRLVMGRDGANQLDVLGGYSIVSIQDALLIESVTTGNPFNLLNPQPFQTVGIRDHFNASNVFQGGHVGGNAKLGYGRLHLDMIGKVHLGNMNQQVTRIGARQTLPGDPGLGAFPDANAPVTQRGVLVTQNQGTFERDVFTFAPELDLKLGIELLDHCMLTVGYSFIYYDSVALAGNQIDNIVDPLGTINVPPYAIKDSGFWFQSLNLGLAINY